MILIFLFLVMTKETRVVKGVIVAGAGVEEMAKGVDPAVTVEAMMKVTMIARAAIGGADTSTTAATDTIIAVIAVVMTVVVVVVVVIVQEKGKNRHYLGRILEPMSQKGIQMCQLSHRLRVL